MKNRRWLLCALVVLLAGCSLAQPEEKKPDGDRFAGFYVVYTPNGSSDKFYNNSYLEEYSAVPIETDQFGTLSFLQEVLFAVEDETGNYVFPGMADGYSLLLVEKNEEYGPVSDMFSNMAPGEEGYAIRVTDSGTSNTISGTIYCGSPLGAENWDKYESRGIWTCYRVYQAADGRVYMDGTGNSMGGGGGFECSEDRTQTFTDWNGKAVTESIDVHVQVEVVERMERLVVTQFDENNAIVRSDDLALRENLPSVKCEAETAWVLVEEISKDSTIRTAYSAPEEGADPVQHMVILLDDEGLGKNDYLIIQ